MLSKVILLQSLEMQVIRYSHYAFSCLGNCPSWITYIRHFSILPFYILLSGGDMRLTSYIVCLLLYLLMIRYTAFIVLYPLGVFPGEGEFINLYLSLLSLSFVYQWILD